MSEDRETRSERPVLASTAAAGQASAVIEFDGPPTVSADVDAELIEDYVAESLDHLDPSGFAQLAQDEAAGEASSPPPRESIPQGGAISCPI